LTLLRVSKVIKMAKNSDKSKFNLTPAPGYLLIEPLEKEVKTASGIYLPDSAGEKPQKGKVLAVGGADITERGVKKDAPCKKNEVVFYKKWGGNEVKIEGKEYLFVKFEDVLAVETA
jgi:chaperonin GroES